MDAALLALAEPRRREILALVQGGELSAGEIASNFPITWPAISQHLGVLKRAGLVAERRQGTRRLYRARPEGLAELRAYLDGFWSNALDRLVREAEAETRTPEGGSTRAREGGSTRTREGGSTSVGSRSGGAQG
jgi:DNA-binding transcriptional ArsR family regulator